MYRPNWPSGRPVYRGSQSLTMSAFVFTPASVAWCRFFGFVAAGFSLRFWLGFVAAGFSLRFWRRLKPAATFRTTRHSWEAMTAGRAGQGTGTAERYLQRFGIIIASRSHAPTRSWVDAFR